MGFDLGVVGLGQVGLTLAREASRNGLRVVGADVDRARVSALLEGTTYVDGLSDDDVGRMLETGFLPTSDPQLLVEARVVAICVPTPLTPSGTPDLRPLRSAARDLTSYARTGQLVVVESTVFPGAAAEIVVPAVFAAGLTVGRDCFVAAAPERLDPGGSRSFGAIHRVVGGATAACAERAREFYESLGCSVTLARGTGEAELAKLIENTYRQVNIALVNELAVAAERLGVDLEDALRCAATKPFGFQAFYPAPGVGGECIPVDPMYLAESARRVGAPLGLVELADSVNRSVPLRLAEQLLTELERRGVTAHKGRVLLVGVGYKAGVGDVRNTPAEPIVRRLREAGAAVSYHDPLVQSWTVDGVAVPRVHGLAGADGTIDLAVLLQRHPAARPDQACRPGWLLDASRGSVLA